MENTARFVVIHECFGVAELLKVKERLKSFASRALEVYSHDKTEVATMAKKLRKSPR
jgi:hypothetical protein